MAQDGLTLDEMSSGDEEEEEDAGVLEDLEEEPVLADSPMARKYREIDHEETFILFDECPAAEEEEERAASAQPAGEQADNSPQPDFLPVEYLLATMEQRQGKDPGSPPRRHFLN